VAASTEALPLRRPWYEGRFASWLVTTDHKRIGILYLSTTLVFFVLGGIMALLIRAQLTVPNEHFITRDRYDTLFTLHGTTMIFLVVVPILAGFGNYLVPLMIGARDVAFPRLNALSYWLFLLGGITLMTSVFSEGGAAKCGWTCYAPLSETQYSPGHGVDLWILSLHLLTLASLISAINFVATIHNMRARGMTWMRIPLFVWTIEVYSLMLVAVLPALGVGLTLLMLDRHAGTHFFDVTHGGSALIWQHVFWFFGHPEVYIMILPAMGIVSEVIPVFSRKPIFAYKAVAFSTVGIGFVSMLVWAHHMFAVGMPIWLDSFFMIASLLVSIPTGVKIFNWLATTWRGNLIFDTPLLFALGFVATFTIGGLTGVMLAAFPVDWQVTDTYFVVGHIHYVLFAGSMLAVFAGLHYWWPKIFGRLLSNRLGKWEFWLMFVGMNLAFFPMHLLGLDGMPRRIYTYAHGGVWESYNITSTVGSSVMALGILLFFLNVFLTHALRRGRRAGNDPWLADTLEWFTPSPPPPYNFDHLPPLTSARPLRDIRRKLQDQRAL
jgi:cytochrome c oxidase subunit 1